jgi:hypothetical protein
MVITAFLEDKDMFAHQTRQALLVNIEQAERLKNVDGELP